MDWEAPTLHAAQLRTAYEFQCTEAECVAALEFNQSRLMRRLQRSAIPIALRALTFVVWFGYICVAAQLVGDDPSRSGRWVALSFGVLLLLCISQFALRRSLFRFIAAGDVILRGRRIMTVEERGLRLRGPHGEDFVTWNGIRSTEELDGQLLLYLDHATFIPIPDSAFSDPVERVQFLADLRRRTALPEQPTKPVSVIQAIRSTAADGTVRDRQRGQAGLLENVMQGLRLAFFLRPRTDASHAPEASWSTLVALVLLGTALQFFCDLVEVGPKGSFSSSGLPGALFGLPVMMLGAWALARLAGRPRYTLTLLTALTSLAIPIDVIHFLFRLANLAKQGSYLGYLSYSIAGIWFTLAAAVGAMRLLGAPRRQWLGATLLIWLLVGLPLTKIDRDGRLWWPPAEEAVTGYERERAPANEEVFYQQPQLLEQQLAALKPGRRGVIDLYFIGVAAYARQDVFMNEVHSVTKLFDERFDTAGRSLALINSPATLSESPIASLTSLGLALKRVAKVMDRDEDILFLFITSHGSKDHNVSFDFWPMQLKTLDPQRLKELLDQSGIRRRVVVVSACYSGAFVDALKDDGTLVIAASAADKNSFGCSNGADFTYFGKAYFDEALRHTYSFSEAFELARPVIAERERKANLDGSDPKMFVGEGIKRTLEEFVNRRQSSVKRSSQRAGR